MKHWRHTLLLGVSVLVAACAGPSPSPAPPTPTRSPATSAPSPTGGHALVFIAVSASVREWCGSIGGCAYFASMSGPGGNWTGELEGTGDTLGSTALPAAVTPGRYTLAFRSAFVSDVVLNGQRQIGPTDAECSATIDVAADHEPRVEAIFDAGSCEITTGT